MVMSRSLFCVAIAMSPLALALCVCSYSSAAEDIWTQKADMQTPRYHFSTCAIDGRIYAIGGLSEGEGGDIPGFSTVERYDPKANRWTNVADMPTARFFPAASLANGKIYVMGGGIPQFTWPWNLLSTLEVYDPITDTWTKNTDMPTPRDRASASTLGGNIYVIGGADEANRAVSTMEKYDPETDTWEGMADMPNRSGLVCTSVVDGRIYAIGGSAGGALSTVQEYTPEGWPFAVSAQGKLAATWGNIKQMR